ncbi:MAG: AAA family ATPase [Saprospiraceae bacterium]
MYLKKISIKNIGCIDELEIEFKQFAGWHVLIGDNGAGKSTILQAIALALVGNNKIEALRLAYAQLIRFGEERGEIELKVKLCDAPDYIYGRLRGINFERSSRNGIPTAVITRKNNSDLTDDKIGFAASFGPFRRFSGGNKEWETLYTSYPKVAAHLSVFGEDVALTESIEWLVRLNYKKLERDSLSAYTLKNLKKFINESNLLPQHVSLEQISSEGVTFKDGNGVLISVTEMSDGFRSVLSLTFELIRQLVFTFGAKEVFQNIEKGEININIPGVVLIDEIDAHLHPTWQTRIGQSLTAYFPAIQFIVTTHSPLVCRAAEKGSIWRLTAPGSNQETYEILSVERDRLIYGNILEAIGTSSFGNNVERSEKSKEMLQKLSNLEVQHTYGKLTKEEIIQMNNLRKIFTTDDTINL